MSIEHGASAPIVTLPVAAPAAASPLIERLVSAHGAHWLTADTVADWAGGDALWKRMQAASALGEAVPAGQLPALQLAREALGGQADDALLSALRGAGSAGEGYALLFASPAFQWRS